MTRPDSLTVECPVCWSPPNYECLRGNRSTGLHGHRKPHAARACAALTPGEKEDNRG